MALPRRQSPLSAAVSAENTMSEWLPTQREGERILRDDDKMAQAFRDILLDHAEYYEVVKPKIVFRSKNGYDGFMFGDGVTAADVSVPRGRPDNPSLIRVDPDGLNYQEGGILIDARQEASMKDMGIVVRAPSETSDEVSHAHSVGAMVIRHD